MSGVDWHIDTAPLAWRRFIESLLRGGYCAKRSYVIEDRDPGDEDVPPDRWNGAATIEGTAAV